MVASLNGEFGVARMFLPVEYAIKYFMTRFCRMIDYESNKWTSTGLRYCRHVFEVPECWTLFVCAESEYAV
jgi:hypothetical protein